MDARSTCHRRAVYAARAHAGLSAAGRYLYQRSTKAMDLLFVNRYVPPQSAPHRHTATPRRQAAWQSAWRPQTCARRAADAAMGLLRLSLAPYRRLYWSHTGLARCAA
jgi:hypothetical protein